MNKNLILVCANSCIFNYIANTRVYYFMKVIQICGLVEGAGITKYMNEMNIGLNAAGYDVKVYEFPTSPKAKISKQENFVDNHFLFDYEDTSMWEDIMSADIVLVHQLMMKKFAGEYRDKFIDFVQNQINGPIKVFFLNDHTNSTMGFTRTYGHHFKDKEFLMTFDKIAMHCDTNTYAKTLKKVLGEEEFYKRYIYMHHPHYFRPESKDNWLNLDNKYKRCLYLGRYSPIKHVETVLELFKKIRNDYEFEIRGIDRLLGYIYKPDLFYEIDFSRKEIRGLDKDCIVGPSKVTWSPTTNWKLENGYTKEDNLIDVPHDNDRIWMFNKYNWNTGMEAMRKSMFGLEFYWLPTKEEHGHNLEYCMHEIIEQGTVAIFDSFAMKSINAFENGEPTEESLFDKDVCLCLNSDLSNWEEIKDKMDEISNNPNLYNEYRERAWEVLSKHLDPAETCRKFIESCIK